MLLRMGVIYSIAVFLLLLRGLGLGRKKHKEDPSLDMGGKKDKKV